MSVPPSTAGELGVGFDPLWVKAQVEGKILGSYFINWLAENLWCAVWGPDALAVLRTQTFFCKSTRMGIPVSLRAEGRVSGRHCCWSSYSYRHTNLLQESMNRFSYMSSFSFYDIYLFQYFHSNCSYEITQT